MLTLSASAGAAPSDIRVLVIGDSLTEGYGVPPEAAYPALLQTKLRQGPCPQCLVVNAGTSGATSAFGSRTLRFHTKHLLPQYLILALGANDGLRGINPQETEKNLDDTLKLAQKKGIQVLLIGMKAPPNYGLEFTQEFTAIYPRLAKKFNIPLIPFLLEGVAGTAHLNLADGIHPNEKGYQIVASLVFQHFKGLIK